MRHKSNNLKVLISFTNIQIRHCDFGKIHPSYYIGIDEIDIRKQVHDM